MRCVFCGADRTLTKEDAFPKWIRRLIGVTTPMEHSWEGPGREATWDSTPFGFKVRCICEPCNTDWLSRLENETKPHIANMILGWGGTLYKRPRATVALWAVKTTMMFQGRNRQSGIPLADYTTLYRRYTTGKTLAGPPGNTQVWLGTCIAPQLVDAFYAHQAVTIGPQLAVDHPNGYLSTFNVGRLAFRIFGHRLDKPIEHLFPREFSRP